MLSVSLNKNISFLPDMVKDHSDRERKPTALFLISNKGSFNCITRIVNTMATNYTSCGALAGKRNSSKGPPGVIDLMTHRTISGCSITEQMILIHKPHSNQCSTTGITGRHILSCLWDSAFKRCLATIGKD